jgi:Ulp1 family protease
LATAQSDKTFWFNDEFINAYFYWLQKKFSTYHFVSTFAFSHTTVVNKFDFSTVTNIIAPVNVNKHWVLLIQDHNQWTVFDSLSGGNRNDTVKGFIKRITHSEKTFNFKYVHIGDQIDGYSCGLFVIIYVTLFTLDPQIPLKKIKIRRYLENLRVKFLKALADFYEHRTFQSFYDYVTELFKNSLEY